MLRILIFTLLALSFSTYANSAEPEDYVKRADTALSRQNYREALAWVDLGLKDFPENKSIREIESRILKTRRFNEGYVSLQTKRGIL